MTHLTPRDPFSRLDRFLARSRPSAESPFRTLHHSRSPRRRDVWDAFDDLREAIDLLSTPAEQRPAIPAGRWGRRSRWGLPVRVQETDSTLNIQAELPGFSQDDITITLQDRRLQIEAAQQQDSGQGSGQDSEDGPRRRRAVSRHFHLSPAVDADQITATLKNGILELTLPKAESAQPQRIPIMAGAAVEQSADGGQSAEA